MEDNADLASAIRKGLEEHGYKVDVSHDGRTGLALARSEPYDLVILDVMLPIARKVWGMEYEPTSNVIDVYVSSLRKKLEPDRGRRSIHTVPGMGYRFGGPT